MGRKLFTFVWILICTYKLHSVDAAFHFINANCIPENGNYTEGSVYQQKLDIVLSDLSSERSKQAFHKSTAGDVPNKIYGLYQCRGDVTQDLCADCIQDATQKIVQGCPLFSEAAVWYEECMLRYANHSIFSVSETYPGVKKWSRVNVSDYNSLGPVLSSTLNGVINDATRNSSRGHFATKSANWTSFDKVYCLAQCTPDLTEFDCRSCLTIARNIMIGSYNTSMYVGIFHASCQLRYDTTQQFYMDMHSQVPDPFGSNTTLPGERPKQSQTDSGLTPPIIGGIAVGALFGVMLLVAVVWFCVRRNKCKEQSTTAGKSLQPPPTKKLDDALLDKSSSFDYDLGDAKFLQYDFASLKAATMDFSTNNKLGEGGFGAVYLGTLNGGQVAIKRLSGNSGQGAKEFITEAHLLAKLQHKNLVKLLGFCNEGDEKLLVYEFLPNTSVDHFLFDPTERSILDWKIRYKIIIGVARGIQYLHEDSRLTIIHRDLKPSNILLDTNMNPKIADFGLARLFKEEQKLANTARIVGTLGYMAPEYMSIGDYSDKSDVYSFGIIILELVSGQKCRKLHETSQSEGLSVHAWRLWEVGRSYEFIDPMLSECCSKNEVTRCIQIGLLCVQPNALHRPTMAVVVLMLTGSIALPPPTAPALSPYYSSPNDDGTQSDQSATKPLRWNTDIEQDLYPG